MLGKGNVLAGAGTDPDAFVRNTAKMKWTAAVGDYTFFSIRLDIVQFFTQIRQERNGVFFP